MKYKLLNPVNPKYSTIETILTNRGIDLKDINTYLNTTDDDINNYMAFGAGVLNTAYEWIKQAINRERDCLLVIDSDCDGYTSAALITNYLYDMAPEWVQAHMNYFIHSGKQHGLADVEVPDNIKLVIVPDAGSNDYEEHRILRYNNKDVIVLDHHEATHESRDAVVINNQLSRYPNKQLSGVGVTWQFCRFIDSKEGTSYADQYLDLVALGLDADMMSLQSIETKHLINKGLFQLKNSGQSFGFPPTTANPFFYYMAEKNAFSLKGELTPIGVAFYIAPYVNAMVRSGTPAEKLLLFKSMLKFEAFKRVPSTKRGHKIGDEERIVDQAVRTVTNVKSRQTKAQEAGMEKLEKLIKQQNLLDSKILLFTLKPGEIDKNIAGLVANKFMAKYQRNTAILTYNQDASGLITWRGSARGYGKSSIASFKDMCESTGLIEYAQGHANAFGLEIRDSNLDEFIRVTNELLADDDGEATYYVDYEFIGNEVNGYNIMDISRLNHLWGQDMPEALIAVKGLKITENILTLMSADKNPTIKITLSNGVCLLKFKSSQEEYDSLYSKNGYVEIDIVGSCNSNEWNGTVTPQIFIKDYQIVDTNQYYF